MNNLINFKFNFRNFLSMKIQMIRWLSTIEQMWILIKSYQKTFSSIMIEKISQELEYSIQSIQPTDLNHRLILLAYIQPFTNKYHCTHLINEHLRINEHFPHLENLIHDFQLLFDFIEKSICLFKLIIQHIIFSGENLSTELYRYTPQTIAHLEHLFHSTLKSIDIIDGQIQIHVKQTSIIFEDFQKKLDEYLTNLHLPISLLSRYGLINFILRVAPLFTEQQHMNSIKNSSSNVNSLIHIDPKQSRKKTMQNEINLIIEKLIDLLSSAKQLPLRPHEIIERIHRTLHQLKTFNIEQESETSYRWILSEEQTLTDLFNRFTIQINQYTTFHAPLPDDRPIHQLNQNELEFTQVSIDQLNSKSNLKNFCEIIRGNSLINHSFSSFNQLIRLTHVQIQSQTWIRAICLLFSNEKDQLRTILMFLNDDLAMESQRTSSNEINQHTFEDKVILTYAQYRCKLLIEENNHQMLSNYIDIAHLTNELHQWTNNTHLNVFNLFETMKKLHDELHLSQNQMRNFLLDSTCHFLPIDLRPEDLLCFFAPEYTSIIQKICLKFHEIDLFLSCRLNKLEPIDISKILPSTIAQTGLSSYVYHHEKRIIPLFDRHKHIYYITEGAINVIQQLIHLFIDSSFWIKISMNVKELFPIHITLSLTLLILIDWTGGYLVDFREHRHLLKLNTLKTEENQLFQLKIKLHQIEQEEILLETKSKNKQHEIVIIRQQIEELTNSYREKLAHEQQQWLIHLFNSFSQISQIIKTFLVNLAKQFGLNFSSSIDHSTLLKIPIIMARHNLQETTNLFLDQIQIENLQKNILQILNNIHLHAHALIPTDPMYLFISFYINLIRLSLSSLINSIRSWKHYSQIFQMKKKMKENICQLNISIRKECSLFLTEIRTGYEQNDLIKHAQSIRNQLRIFSANNRIFDELICQFERFIFNLILIGYRYVQLQRGQHQSFDDLLIDIPNDMINSNIPNTEVDLLNLLDDYEIQLTSYCNSLLYLPLHFIFNFNSNLFHIFNQLQYSFNNLIKYVLPTAYMIQRTWLTIDQLIHQISPTITEREYIILEKLSRNFLEFTNSSNEIDFLLKQFPFDLLEIISKHLDDLNEILLESRSKMNFFCQDLHHRWHLTLKEIFRGFIQRKKFDLHCQLTFNQYSINETFRVIDIERILQGKIFRFQSIDSHQRLKLIRLQILSQLLLGGIDHLQIILLKMPIEQIDSIFFLKLFKSIREIYHQSENILLEQSLFKLINDQNHLKKKLMRIMIIYFIQ